ncbi:MAG: glycosyl hydrolase, partial [Bacteroidota bacterium]|nr:glycosyl hydrolase [Bacteroidota bacterium]
FASEFKARKGYDILPELPHLFIDLSPRSGKIRLDYNDVMVALSEEGFFKPVYNWHTSRGMLFGCDHGGRGRDVTEFGDYFRTQRWMSGPGCDQPGLGKDIVKAKVASSISHLYERPRTWLEGYYGSGWGTSSEEVADATFTDFAMGHNLLSLHGLYYSTHGSMWEWAAPDNHWRQPYWANMGDFLKCSERLSYVLSQGVHCCDVAMIYPVAPVVASLNGKDLTKTAFTLANDLYPAGIDFDFMDFESLNRSRIDRNELQVSGEKYKVLILPGLSAVKYSTIEKALEFFRSGGIVLAIGSLPAASDRVGGDDELLQSKIREMFGTTFSEKHDTTVVYSKKSKSGGTGLFISNPLEAKKIIGNLIQPDFKVLTGNIIPGILHRHAGNRDLYFVYGLPKGTSCFFRASGKVEIWNPWDGSTKPLKVSSTSKLGTTIALPLEKSEPQLIVFSPGKPEIEKLTSASSEKISTLTIDNKWEFELKPTLDNHFGDYRLPAFDGKLGVEVWKMKFAEEKNAGQGQNPQSDDSQWASATVGYGPEFWKLGPLPNNLDSALVEAKLSSLKQINPDEPVELNGKKYYWKPYEFSWRWGLKDDAGHQGYHGLKGFINDENISLGSIDRSTWVARPIYPLKPEAEGTVYYLWSAVSSPKKLQSKIIQSGLVPQRIYVNHKLITKGKDFVELNEGYNPVLLKYSNIGRGVLVFRSNLADSTWKQSVPLATNWYLNPAVLSYNFRPNAKDLFGWYQFMSPPGTRAVYVTSKAKPEVWVAGKKYLCELGKLEAGRIADSNLQTWKVTLPDNLTESASVALKIEQLPGFFGGSALPEPVVFECGKGVICLGDLGENESLKTYSGGMWYRKSIKITEEQAKAAQILFDLGKVVATAEVFVNGKAIGTKVTSPWTFDLSGKLTSGDNKIEILVYNTLGNHYLNTISQYVGRTNSGLIGPVKIDFYS